ncbi:hypothetical protein M9H77_17520 [Catharanthus roseus]|uniref:Uncharacterized protein n=1 Tax=Catharanthus roseus TaxID=4058 RepID=A0ACC0B4T8_CATRO|nr:hypothetical protein M9H77_17520 [Catharanthus roseus]
MSTRRFWFFHKEAEFWVSHEEPSEFSSSFKKMNSRPSSAFKNTQHKYLLIQRYYINYKLMKKKVKHYVHQIEVSTENSDYVFKDFSRILDKQNRMDELSCKNEKLSYKGELKWIEM